MGRATKKRFVVRLPAEGYIFVIFKVSKRPVGRIYLAAPSTTEVKIEWNSTSTPPHAFIMCIGTTLLTQCSTVLPKKLRIFQLVKNSPSFSCNPMFITVYIIQPLISILSERNSFHSYNHFFNHMFSFSLPSTAPGVNCLNFVCVVLKSVDGSRVITKTLTPSFIIIFYTLLSSTGQLPTDCFFDYLTTLCQPRRLYSVRRDREAMINLHISIAG